QDVTMQSVQTAVLMGLERGSGMVSDRISMIDIDLVDTRRDRNRRSLNEDRMNELPESIRAYGVLQPLRLPRRRGPCDAGAGHRRLIAAGRAGLAEVPAVVVDADDRQAFMESLIENIQREDLNPVDRGEALRRLREDLDARSWEEVGRAIGLSRRHVYHLLNV